MLKFKRVFNLGEDCECIWRMRTFDIPVEGPFNDKGIALSSLLYLLTTNMFDMFKLENLQVLDPLPPYFHHANKYLRVVDRLINGETFHVFPKDKPLEASYLPFRERLESDIQTFINSIRNDEDKLLFIHKKSDIDTISDMSDIKNQYRALIETITLIRAGKPYLVVGVGFSDVFDIEWGIPNLKTFKINSPKLWEVNAIPERAWCRIARMVKPEVIFL